MLTQCLLLWFSSAPSYSADSLCPWARWVPPLPAQEKAEYGNGNTLTVTAYGICGKEDAARKKNSWAAELSWKPLLKVTCILVILNKAQGSTNIGIYWEPPCTQMYQWLTGWNIHTDFCQEHKSIFFLPEKRYWLYCYQYVAFNLYSSINWALGFLIK